MNQYFVHEVDQAKSFINEKVYDKAFYHLERAHVIGQRSVILHAISHFYMLKIGILKRDFREIIGQLIRLPLGILGSAVGIVPTGNTGGSNVSAFVKMDIPEDLKKMIDRSL